MSKRERKDRKITTLMLSLDEELLEGIREMMREVADLDETPSTKDFTRLVVDLASQLIFDAKDGFTEVYVRRDDSEDHEERHRSVPDRIKIACLVED